MNWNEIKASLQAKSVASKLTSSASAMGAALILLAFGRFAWPDSRRQTVLSPVASLSHPQPHFCATPPISVICLGLASQYHSTASLSSHPTTLVNILQWPETSSCRSFGAFPVSELTCSPAVCGEHRMSPKTTCSWAICISGLESNSSSR